MEYLRHQSPKNIAGINVNCVEDYLTGKANFADGYSEDLYLPKENVLKFKLEDESWIAIRPSGTEPKCKYYFGVVGETAEIADKKLLAIQEAFEKLNDESC